MQMPVFSRLSTYAVTIGVMLGSAATALAAPGQPSSWALGLQEAASPVMADITWFHNFLLVLITADHGLRPGAAPDRDDPVQRQGQSDPLAHHP